MQKKIKNAIVASSLMVCMSTSGFEVLANEVDTNVVNSEAESNNDTLSVNENVEITETTGVNEVRGVEVMQDAEEFLLTEEDTQTIEGPLADAVGDEVEGKVDTAELVQGDKIDALVEKEKVTSNDRAEALQIEYDVKIKELNQLRDLLEVSKPVYEKYLSDYEKNKMDENLFKNEQEMEDFIEHYTEALCNFRGNQWATQTWYNQGYQFYNEIVKQILKENERTLSDLENLKDEDGNILKVNISEYIEKLQERIDDCVKEKEYFSQVVDYYESEIVELDTMTDVNGSSVSTTDWICLNAAGEIRANEWVKKYNKMTDSEKTEAEKKFLLDENQFSILGKYIVFSAISNHCTDISEQDANLVKEQYEDGINKYTQNDNLIVFSSKDLGEAKGNVMEISEILKIRERVLAQLSELLVDKEDSVDKPNDNDGNKDNDIGGSADIDKDSDNTTGEDQKNEDNVDKDNGSASEEKEKTESEDKQDNYKENSTKDNKTTNETSKNKHKEDNSGKGGDVNTSYASSVGSYMFGTISSVLGFLFAVFNKRK